jgi:hypothetical protein
LVKAAILTGGYAPRASDCQPIPMARAAAHTAHNASLSRTAIQRLDPANSRR